MKQPKRPLIFDLILLGLATFVIYLVLYTSNNSPDITEDNILETEDVVEVVEMEYPEESTPEVEEMIVEEATE
jgi:hypothetical protein